MKVRKQIFSYVFLSLIIFTPSISQAQLLEAGVAYSMTKLWNKGFKGISRDAGEGLSEGLKPAMDRVFKEKIQPLVEDIDRRIGKNVNNIDERIKERINQVESLIDSTIIKFNSVATANINKINKVADDALNKFEKITLNLLNELTCTTKALDERLRPKLDNLSNILKFNLIDNTKEFLFGGARTSCKKELEIKTIKSNQYSKLYDLNACISLKEIETIDNITTIKSTYLDLRTYAEALYCLHKEKEEEEKNKYVVDINKYRHKHAIWEWIHQYN